MSILLYRGMLFALPPLHTECTEWGFYVLAAIERLLCRKRLPPRQLECPRIRILCIGGKDGKGRKGWHPRGTPFRFASLRPLPLLFEHLPGAGSGQISKNQRAPPPALVRGWTSPRGRHPFLRLTIYKPCHIILKLFINKKYFAVSLKIYGRIVKKFCIKGKFD